MAFIQFLFMKRVLEFKLLSQNIIAEVTEYSNVTDGFKLSINLELIDEENN